MKAIATTIAAGRSGAFGTAVFQDAGSIRKGGIAYVIADNADACGMALDQLLKGMQVDPPQSPHRILDSPLSEYAPRRR